MNNELFRPGDSRLCDYELEGVVRNLLIPAVESGRISGEDVKFLIRWESGTYFQTAPVPVMFPFDKDVSDIARVTGSFKRFKYYDDAEVVYDGVKYRVLELWGERALSALLNWLKERGITESELKLGNCAVNGPDDGEDFDLGLGKTSLTANRTQGTKKKERLLSKTESEAAFASLDRLADGSIPASEVKNVLRMQLKLHSYKPTSFAAGVGIPKQIVVAWCRGQLVIKPNEIKSICNHLGVENLFEGLPYSTARSRLRGLREQPSKANVTPAKEHGTNIVPVVDPARMRRASDNQPNENVMESLIVLDELMRNISSAFNAKDWTLVKAAYDIAQRDRKAVGLPSYHKYPNLEGSVEDVMKRLA